MSTLQVYAIRLANEQTNPVRAHTLAGRGAHYHGPPGPHRVRRRRPEPHHPELLDGRLLVADGQAGRVSVWTGAGELEREIEVVLGFVSDFAVLPDGRLVFTGQGFGRSESALGVYEQHAGDQARQ